MVASFVIVNILSIQKKSMFKSRGKKLINEISKWHIGHLLILLLIIQILKCLVLISTLFGIRTK